ncbi:haloacid dehalogenase, type II [Aspergillus unguis]
MNDRKKIVVAFDLYDTLLSPASIAKPLELMVLPEKAEPLALRWRSLLLEYTLKLSTLGRLKNYRSILTSALCDAARDLRTELSKGQVDVLVRLYDSLDTFPDVAAALDKIKSHSNITAVIFFNGQKIMVQNAFKYSRALKSRSGMFSKIITADEAREFTPGHQAYEKLAERMGKKLNQLQEIYVVSGNAFEVVGAINSGLSTAWVNRSGGNWRGELFVTEKPTVSAQRLDDLMDEIIRHAGLSEMVI